MKSPVDLQWKRTKGQRVLRIMIYREWQRRTVIDTDLHHNLTVNTIYSKVSAEEYFDVLYRTTQYNDTTSKVKHK
jgi:hypothetical protein